MAHELEIVNGQASLMLANRPAWHGLGTVLDHAPTSYVACEQSKQDWRTLLMPLQTCEGQEVPGFLATVREDTKAILGVVSDRYQVVQNWDAFKFLDSLVEDGEMTYESAGCLNGGKQVFVLGRLPSVDQIAEGDDVLRYVLFTHGHDGGTGINIIPTPTRVVCANTLRRALGGLKGFSHTGDMAAKMIRAKRYVSQFDDTFTLFRDEARLLADRRFTESQVTEYLDVLFPTVDKITKEPLTGRSLTIVQNKRREIQNARRFERNNLPAIKGTWWALMNSITDAIDHSDRQKADTAAKKERRFMNLMDGDAAEVKAKAFSVALEMSA